MNTPVKPAIEKGLFHTPFWLVPEKDVFAARAVRFQELAQAEKSEWRLYLELLAALCNAQAVVAARHDIALPKLNTGETVLPEAFQGNVPSEFFAVFTGLIAEMDGKTNHTAAAELGRLKKLDRSEAEALAQRVLTENTADTDRAAEIWVQAALQIVWTAWAAQLGEDDVPPVEERVLCPCCGTEAVGSVILIRGDLAGFRYMHCPLCNSRWNALRAKCPTCGDAGNVRIWQFDQKATPDLAPAYTAAHAESCKSCHSYRKLYRLDEQQYADPVADDLATLGLDMAVGEEGFGRGGTNPFLLLGA
ncbi:formate dehydrogenase accessory protein FdhE [Neisseria chenwenguii]|nr:formate dehydrogenase accessory protein FdhE [Neisseria chenwenguii]